MPYSALETELFAKQWKGLCKKDKPLEDRLRDVVKAIIANPENYDSPLKGNRCRSFKKKAVSNHYRVIYRYCKMCLQVQQTRCEKCVANEYSEDSIVFEEVFHRDEDY